jgi:hypothetical protein
VTFIDDVRITGHFKGNCNAVCRQFAARIHYRGMQDSLRKFRPPLQINAGAWTGTLCKVGEQLITKLVSQEKSEKGRRIATG